MRHTLVPHALVLASLTLALGCASKTATHTAGTPVRRTPTQGAPATEHQQSAVREAVLASQGGGLVFSREITELCPGLESPRFEYDSSDVQAAWVVALQRLASCMNDGKLRGRSLMLTGHADPRGDEGYNMALGSRRAEAVKDALTAFRVDPVRVCTTSRGKADAVGTDEASWALDRRVDVGLGEGA